MSARRIALCTAAVLVLCAWCGWASGFHQSTPGALAAWSASLAGVAAVDFLLWRDRRHRHRALHLRPVDHRWPRPAHGGAVPTLVGIAPWLALALVVVVWEVLGIDTAPNVPHLTISALSLAFRPVESALLLIWMLVGLGYGVARAREPIEDESGRSGGVASSNGSTGASVTGTHLAKSPALLLPHDRGVGVVFWLGLVVACVLVDVTARRSHDRFADAGDLVRLISGPPVARVVLIVAWAYAGWHLFAH